MTTLKALVVGGVLGILSTLVGVSAAHAKPLGSSETIDSEDQRISYDLASEDAARGNARGYHCEVIRLEDGMSEASCDEVDHEALNEVCSEFATRLGLSGDDIDTVHEACMVIGLHTGAVQ